MDEFHVWIGRMLTPSDRSNFSGPWFMSALELPRRVQRGRPGFGYIGPRGTEEVGREVGTTVWGDIGKGKFKYYLGMLDVDDAPATTPLYTGRLQLRHHRLRARLLRQQHLLRRTEHRGHRRRSAVPEALDGRRASATR